MKPNIGDCDFSARQILTPLAYAQDAIALTRSAVQRSKYYNIWEKEEVFETASALSGLLYPRMDSATLQLLDLGLPMALGVEAPARTALGLASLLRRINCKTKGLESPDAINRSIYPAKPVEWPVQSSQLRALERTIQHVGPRDLPMLLRALMAVYHVLFAPWARRPSVGEDKEADFQAEENLILARLAIPLLLARQRPRYDRVASGLSHDAPVHDDAAWAKRLLLLCTAHVALAPYPPSPPGRGVLTHWLGRALSDIARSANAARTRLLMLEARAQQLEAEGLPSPMVSLLIGQPVVNGTAAARVLGLTLQGANVRLRQLEAAGILAEVSGRARFKLYRLSPQFSEAQQAPLELSASARPNSTANQDAAHHLAEADAAIADIDRLLGDAII